RRADDLQPARDGGSRRAAIGNSQSRVPAALRRGHRWPRDRRPDDERGRRARPVPAGRDCAGHRRRGDLRYSPHRARGTTNMTRIALATCAALPDLDPDEQLLLEPLRALGVDAIPAVWDDATIDWSTFDLTVIRS